jgi:hypothetical protein
VKPTETKPVNRVILELGYSSAHPEEYSLTVLSDEYKSLTKEFYL